MYYDSLKRYRIKGDRKSKPKVSDKQGDSLSNNLGGYVIKNRRHCLST